MKPLLNDGSNNSDLFFTQFFTRIISNFGTRQTAPTTGDLYRQSMFPGLVVCLVFTPDYHHHPRFKQTWWLTSRRWEDMMNVADENGAEFWATPALNPPPRLPFLFLLPSCIFKELRGHGGANEPWPQADAPHISCSPHFAPLFPPPNQLFSDMTTLHLFLIGDSWWLYLILLLSPVQLLCSRYRINQTGCSGHISEVPKWASGWGARRQWSNPESTLLTTSGVLLRSQQRYVITPALPKTMFLAHFSKMLSAVRTELIKYIICAQTPIIYCSGNKSSALIGH